MVYYNPRSKIKLTISDGSQSTLEQSKIYEIVIPVKGCTYYFEALGIKDTVLSLLNLWTADKNYIGWQIHRDYYAHIIQRCPADRMPHLMAAIDKGTIVLTVTPYIPRSTK